MHFCSMPFKSGDECCSTRNFNTIFCDIVILMLHQCSHFLYELHHKCTIHNSQSHSNTDMKETGDNLQSSLFPLHFCLVNMSQVEEMAIYYFRRGYWASVVFLASVSLWNSIPFFVLCPNKQILNKHV